MKPLINEKKAAEILDFKIQTLRNRRFKGMPPKYVKMSSRAVRYRMEDLEAFIEEHTIDPENRE